MAKEKTVTYEVILSKAHADELWRMGEIYGMDDLDYLNDFAVSFIEEKTLTFNEKRKEEDQ